MYGLLLPDGRLFDVGALQPGTSYQEDGATLTGTVVTVAGDVPRGVPLAYDAPNQRAVADTTRQAAQALAAAAEAQASVDAKANQGAVQDALAQWLLDIAAELTRAGDIKTEGQTVQDHMDTMITAIGNDPAFPTTATTVAQLRGHTITAIGILSTRIGTLAAEVKRLGEHTESIALGAERQVTRFRAFFKWVAAKLGIPIPGGSSFGQGAQPQGLKGGKKA